MSDVYLIGGPNGSGKTTVAKKLLPNFLGVIEYVNADEIAAGLSPFNPESVAYPSRTVDVRKTDNTEVPRNRFCF